MYVSIGTHTNICIWSIAIHTYLHLYVCTCIGRSIYSLCVPVCYLFLLAAKFKGEPMEWGCSHFLIHMSNAAQMTAMQVFSCCQWDSTMMRRDHPLMEKDSISASGLICILAFSFAFVAWLQHDARKQRPQGAFTQKGHFTDSCPGNVSDAFLSDYPHTWNFWCRILSPSLYFTPVILYICE